MLLIAEILLTIAAWKKGWGARAILPMGIVLVLAFIVGFLGGAAGASEGTILGLCLTLDLVGITALIIMTVNPPQRVEGDKREKPQMEAVTARN